MKILNLYAGIGGNRKLWPIKDADEVVAVEIEPKIAEIYQRFFPKDKVIIADAHQYLLEHYKEFDFIWSSPPCPTHSHTNNFLNAQGIVRYPDMALYQEIIFLKHFFKGVWVVENVRPYYEPLIKPQEAGRHCFWSNASILSFAVDKGISVTNCKGATRRTWKEHISSLQKLHGFDLSCFKQIGKYGHYKLLANCVKPELGLHVWNCAFKEKQLTIELSKGVQ